MIENKVMRIVISEIGARNSKEESTSILKNNLKFHTESKDFVPTAENMSYLKVLVKRLAN